MPIVETAEVRTPVEPSLVEPSLVEPSLVEPSAGERANGWTAESLTAYLQQRRHEEARGLAGIGGRSPYGQPSRCDAAYCPWAW